MLVTASLLGVGLYIPFADSGGPSATQLLAGGLLSLGVLVLALVSAVNVLLWGRAARAAWGLRAALFALALVGAVLVFQFALWASDPNEPSWVRAVGLALFWLAVVAGHWLNLRMVRRFRTRAEEDRSPIRGT